MQNMQQKTLFWLFLLEIKEKKSWFCWIVLHLMLQVYLTECPVAESVISSFYFRTNSCQTARLQFQSNCSLLAVSQFHAFMWDTYTPINPHPSIDRVPCAPHLNGADWSGFGFSHSRRKPKWHPAEYLMCCSYPCRAALGQISPHRDLWKLKKKSKFKCFIAPKVK